MPSLFSPICGELLMLRTALCCDTEMPFVSSIIMALFLEDHDRDSAKRFSTSISMMSRLPFKMMAFLASGFCLHSRLMSCCLWSGMTPFWISSAYSCHLSALRLAMPLAHFLRSRFVSFCSALNFKDSVLCLTHSLLFSLCTTELRFFSFATCSFNDCSSTSRRSSCSRCRRITERFRGLSSSSSIDMERIDEDNASELSVSVSFSSTFSGMRDANCIGEALIGLLEFEWLAYEFGVSGICIVRKKKVSGVCVEMDAAGVFGGLSAAGVFGTAVRVFLIAPWSSNALFSDSASCSATRALMSSVRATNTSPAATLLTLCSWFAAKKHALIFGNLRFSVVTAALYSR